MGEKNLKRAKNTTSKTQKSTEFWRQQTTSKANVYNENSSKKHPFFFFPETLILTVMVMQLFDVDLYILANKIILIWFGWPLKRKWLFFSFQVHKEVFNFIFQPNMTDKLCAHSGECYLSFVLHVVKRARTDKLSERQPQHTMLLSMFSFRDLNK